MGMLPLKFPPGVARNGTQYSMRGRWYDTNLIRWVDNFMRPIGGWKAITAETASEPFRAVISWTDNSGAPWTAFGSADKLFVRDETGANVYDITPDTLNFNPGGIVGYGSGVYGADIYGITRPSSTTINQDDLWVFDTFGETLLALHTGDGRLFQWLPTTPTVLAAQVTNAPIGAKWMIVTNERHCMLFGTDSNFATFDDPRAFIWCDRENLTDWDVTSDANTAGELKLQTAGRIVGATLVPTGILCGTSEEAHAIRFVGGNFVYGRQKISSHCGLVSGKSLVPTPNGAVWVGQSNFWEYDGTVKPLECSIVDWFYKDGNITRPVTVFGGINEEFREVWFFRPAITSGEPDEYAIFSFRQPGQPWWAKGVLSRHAMSKTVVGEKPLMTLNQTLYAHEFGWLDDGATRGSVVFAKSGAFELGNGDRVMHAKKYFQDIDGDHPQDHLPFTVAFEIKQAPLASSQMRGPYALNAMRGYTDVRFRARQASIIIRQDEDEYWSMGTGRLEVSPGGGR